MLNTNGDSDGRVLVGRHSSYEEPTEPTEANGVKPGKDLLDFWTNELEGSKAAIIPYDKRRPELLDFSISSASIQISEPVARDVQAYCQRHHVTPRIALLSAFRAAQYRLTGSSDANVAICSRGGDGTLYLQCVRSRVEEDESFDGLVQNINATVSRAASCPNVHLQQIASGLGRDGHGSEPLVKILFAVNEGAHALHENSRSSPLELEIHCNFTRPSTLHITVHYLDGLYDAAIIENMLSVFSQALKACLQQPDHTIASQSLLTSEGYHRLEALGFVTSPQAESSTDQSIIDIFGDHVLSTPDHVALKDATRFLTYQQLDAESNGIARWIWEKDLQKDAVIAVFAPRSCEAIVAFLGILKAGRAYLPLDTRTPPSRLTSILSQLPGPHIVMLGSELSPPNFGTEIEFAVIQDVVADAHARRKENRSVDPGIRSSVIPPQPSDLAYIMFTSGSTGEPKGVMVEHRSIINLAHNKSIAEHLPKPPTMTHVANIAFDAATLEIYTALLNGGTLICVDQMTALDTAALASIYQKEGVNAAVLTAALFKQHLQASAEAFAPLKMLIVGGDRLDIDDIQAYQRAVNGVFINAYGPTENTVVGTIYCIGPNDDLSGLDTIPIGRAISNTGALVMDSSQGLVPLGVIGELVLTGHSLARGYTNKARSEEQFVNVTVAGSKLRGYRTGDLVRYRPGDHQLEFLGRIDSQVKIRGQRIELGEIEAILKGHNAVSDAAVVLQGSGAATELTGFMSLQALDDDTVKTPGHDHLSMWVNSYEQDVYENLNEIDEGRIGRDFTGWTSMYDGSLIPENEMEEWLEDTINTIVGTGPVRHVLEIGTGTGMVLFNLPSTLESYIGIEPSRKAIKYVQRAVKHRPELLGKVRLHHGSAVDIGQMETEVQPGTIVVINSVSQYFPTQKYINDLVDTISSQLKEVKAVIFGDIRSKALYTQFQVAKVLQQRSGILTTNEVQVAMASDPEDELEMLIDPAFFTSMVHRFNGRVHHVEVLPKAMAATNELSAYRFTVVLHLGGGPEGEQMAVKDLSMEWIDYNNSGGRGSMKDLLQSARDHDLLAVKNVPNHHLTFENKVIKRVEALEHDDSDELNWLSSIRQTLGTESQHTTQYLRELGNSLGFTLEVSCARQFSTQGALDIVFHKLPSAMASRRVLLQFPSDHSGRTEESLTNNPALQHRKQRAHDEVAQIMQSRLPSYMIPRRITIMEKLPINDNGKVDRKKLAATTPSGRGTKREQTIRPPATAAEIAIRDIWSNVLNISASSISLDDSFFQLGGSSITAMRVVSEARAAGRALATADIFRNPSLAAVASCAYSDKAQEEHIAPFSLLTTGLVKDDFLKEISMQYGIVPNQVEDVYPCTPLQQGLVLLTLQRPGDYILQSRLLIPDERSVEELQIAMEKVVEATPILRTRVTPHATGLFQVVLKEETQWIRATGLQEYLAADRKLSVNFGQPLCRYAIVSEGEQKWLIWTIHHTLFDGFSMPLILKSLHGVLSGDEPTVGPSFKSFIKYIESRNAEAATQYWTKYLQGCEESPIFPSSLSSRHEVRSDAAIERTIAQPMIETKDITISSLIRGALAIVLGQSTSSSNVLFGVTLSGRNAPVTGIESMMGPTFATVPVRVRVDMEQSLQSFLKKVQDEATQMIPFEQTGLTRIADISPSCKQASQFQTLLVIQAHGAEKHDEGAKVEWRTGSDVEEQWFNPYALMIEIHLGTDTLRARASFDSRIVASPTVEGILKRLDHVLLQLSTAGGTASLSDVGLLPPTELQQIWSGNKILPTTVDRCLHDMISEQARLRPEATAVHAWDGQFTYRELNLLSDTLAHKLVDAGVRPETLVPLCFDKSKWTAIAMISVWKAGGASVLLDPSLPEQRLKNVIRQADSGLSIILCSKSKTALASSLAKNVLPVCHDTVKIESSSQLPLLNAISPATAAVVSFTSGSTGVPKGVVLEHSQYASLVTYQSRTLGFTAKDRVFDFASYAFDVATYSTIFALANGACLCVPSDSDRKDNVAKIMSEMRVTHANLTPSVARLIEPQAVPTLKTLMLAGEASSQEDFRRWEKSEVHLINAYGPAECPCSNINADARSPLEFPSIGKPYGGATWVVNPQNVDVLVPIGSVGELLIEGPCLSRGYLNSPEKTSASFIDDPKWLLRGSSDRPGRHGRLYKTGDLVQSSLDGSLTFIGRKDTMVKIRGQRVELGEVEQCLLSCLTDASTVVVDMVQLSRRGTKSVLAAFVETRPDGDISSRGPQYQQPSEIAMEQTALPPAIHDQLRELLPQYMVPEVVFTLPRLPYNLSHKIDRKQLRDMAAAITLQTRLQNNASDKSDEQPRTLTEQVLQRVWAQVLDIKNLTDIGRDDSFFALGGNSIDAMMVVGEARKAGLEVTVSSIFRSPRLRQVASSAISHSLMLGSEQSARSDLPLGLLPVIPRLQNNEATEQSYAQGRLWFIEQLHPGLSWYAMPIALRLRGSLKVDALRSALSALSQRHEVFRTTFFQEDGISKQRVQDSNYVPFKILNVDTQAALSKSLEAEQTAPFDLTKKFAWRASLYQVTGEGAVLSLVLHHIIGDGWSVDIIRHELAVLYSAALHSTQDLLALASNLPIPPVQYRDYAYWQRQQEGSADHQRQLNYWVQQLESSRPAEFICDKHRPGTLSGKASSQELKIGGSVHSALDDFCKTENVTPFTVLLAAFRTAHFRLTGVEDATIGCPNANRDRWEVKDLIGFFVNLQCIRVPIEEQMSFVNLVHQVHATVTDSFDNQDVPFEKIVSKLQKERDLSRNPLVQVIFVVHSQQDLGKFEFEGVKTEAMQVDITSRFDIEFHLFQESDGLRGEIVYSEDLYDAATISAISSVFSEVLETGLAQPAQEVVSMSLCSADSQISLHGLRLLDVESTVYPRQSTVVDVFREQVASNRSKIAVVDDRQRLTYEALDSQSDQIGEWLRTKQFPAEHLVGIFADRSCEAVIAMLGVLKANLAYLPFDIKTPAGRMEKILNSIEGKVVILVGTEGQPPLVDHGRAELVSISDILKHVVNGYTNGHHEHPPSASPTPNSLAHVMFTSGSTGVPKGVMIEHRGILRLVKNSNFNHHDVSRAVVAHITNLAFDISTWEIYVTLLNGGSLICIDTPTVLELTRLPDIFHRHQIGVVFFTPKLLEQYIASCPSVLSKLQVIYSGGDYFEPNTLRAARRHTRGKIVNVWGPAENSVVSTCYPVPEDELCVNGVPIGRAVSNCGVYVMDHYQRLVPLGVLGEMVVTGDGVARGYTDPERNQAFVTINVNGQEVRAYRTGDCARYRPSDGMLEFVCRMDRQVKVRGNRVELAEVEHALRSHASVSGAVVGLVGQEGDRKDIRLAGFVTLEKMTDAQLAAELADDSGGDSGNDSGVKGQVQAWETMFDVDTYAGIEAVDVSRLGRDYSGWISMFDNQKFSEAAMDEWLEDALTVMLNGSHPGDVLEIGCGTGMMLFNLVDGLKSYAGVDPSQRAVDFVHRGIKAFPGLETKVNVQRGSATDFKLITENMSPKLVVINSVAQYFPSEQYIFDLIEGLLELGTVETIFFGDIRSFALHRQFQVTWALRNLSHEESLLKEDVLNEMGKIERGESELVLSPEFFTSLKDSSRFAGMIEHVEVLPKKMTATNELSCYRYAAVIHIRQPSCQRTVHEVPSDLWVDFAAGGLTKAKVIDILRDRGEEPGSIGVSNIPYSKTIAERCILDSLGAKSQDQWLSQSRQSAVSRPSLSATDLIDIAREAGYRVELSWARQTSQNGGLDAIFHHVHPDVGQDRVLFNFPNDHVDCPSSRMSSQPLLQQVKQKTITELRGLLETLLPPYMIPETITVLPELPLNANGKIDRKVLTQLAMAENIAPPAQKTRRQPENEIQKRMREVWADVLRRPSDNIGLDDNFFLLGGNSITAMRLVSKARTSGLQLNVADIFRLPTLEQLADLPGLTLGGVKQSTKVNQPWALLPKQLPRDALLERVSKLTGFPISALDDAYPCTPLQEGLMALAARRPGDYVMQVTLNLSAHVSLPRFKTAWADVVEAFPILRTRIIRDDDAGFLQAVINQQLMWTEVTELNSHLDSDLRTTMGLGTALADFALIINGSGVATHFVWTLHHAVYDGWSLGLIMKAFQQAYDGSRLSVAKPFQPFVEYLQQQDPAQANEYWRHQLNDFDGSCYPKLPRSVSQPLSDTVIEHQFAFDGANQFGVTTAILLRAAWALVAGQLTNSRDTAFGVTVSGRNAPVAHVEEIVAPTFATVPIRIKWDQAMTVSQYLRGVQEQATNMIPYEQSGLQHIAPSSDGCKRACDFQSLLVVQDGFDKIDSPLITVSKGGREQHQNFNPYALMLEIDVGSRNVTVKATFDSCVIQSNVMTRVMERLSHVMQQFKAATPEQILSQIQVVSPQDLESIRLWNQDIPESIQDCVHNVISKRALEHPNAMAIDAWNGSLTYAQLENWSNVFAGQLQAAGVGTSCIIPLCFEKSRWTAVAVMSVLKTGAAFVLLDVSLPEERLRGIVEQSGSTLIVASETAQELASRISSRVIALKETSVSNSSGNMHPNGRHLRDHVDPQSLCCVVFTSGSTGKPKGAMLTHANLVSGLHHQSSALRGFTEKSRVFDFASHAFDIAIHNIVATLATGGCLCVPSEEQRKERLVETMAAMRVTTADLTPSVARLLDPANVPSLRVLILAGEAVTETDAARFLNHRPSVEVVNAYGPAECGISTINSDQQSAKALTSIGKGTGAICWVVEPNNPERLVGPGCPGELLLEGPIVGKGYLNDEETSGRSFIPRPQSWPSLGKSKARNDTSFVYRTGDIVQYNEDGRLFYLGRKDSAQVKIRGQRVELGEIEFWVRRALTSVGRIAVEVIDNMQETMGGAQSLVAFVEVCRESLPSDNRYDVPAEQMASITRYLPAYMIPSTFLAVESLPLTVTRKVDRAQLRQLGSAYLDSMGQLGGDAVEGDMIAETDELARDLASVIYSINLSSSVAPSNDTRHRRYRNMRLQDCGLDSITLMSLKFKLAQTFGVDIKMHALIDRELTIQDLAKLVDDARNFQAGHNDGGSDISRAKQSSVNLLEEIERYDKPLSDLKHSREPALDLPHNDRRTFFLTGANGFIGTQILRRLLSQPQEHKVIALVRGESQAISLQRTISAAKQAQWWHDDYLGRLSVWKGDLSEPELGLDSERAEILATSVDTIIHNGAVVHWGKSYRDLEAANVASTAYLAQVVTSKPQLNMTYVTGGQAAIYADGEEEMTAETLSTTEVIGYTQTKFVSEALVRRAAQRWPGNFSVVNLGLVVGTAEEGIANADDYLWRLAAACIKAGIYDGEAAAEWLDVAEVGTVARTIVNVANNPSAKSEEQSSHRNVVPVGGGMSWRGFWETLQGMGYQLQATSTAKWKAIIAQDMSREQEKHPLWPVAHMIQGETELTDGELEAQVHEARVDVAPEDDAAYMEGNEASQLNRAVVKSTEFLARLGHLPMPGSEPGISVEECACSEAKAFKRSGM